MLKRVIATMVNRIDILILFKASASGPVYVRGLCWISITGVTLSELSMLDG